VKFLVRLHGCRLSGPVNDLIVLLVIAAFFGLCVAYISWCDRIITVDTPEAIDTVDNSSEVSSR